MSGSAAPSPARADKLRAQTVRMKFECCMRVSFIRIVSSKSIYFACGGGFLPATVFRGPFRVREFVCVR